MLVTISVILIFVAFLKINQFASQKTGQSSYLAFVAKNNEELASLAASQDIATFGQLGKLCKKQHPDCYEDMSDEEVGRRLMTRNYDRFFTYTSSPIANLLNG